MPAALGPEGPAVEHDAESGVEHVRQKEAHSANGYSTKYIILCLLGYSLSFIIFGSQVSILGPTIKPLAEQLGVKEPDLSPLFTALGISCIVSGTPSGWLVDRVPTHYVLIGSLLVEAVGFALVPWMPSVWSLTALYFIICFSYNFTNSAVFTSLGWMFPQRAGSALNLVLAMFGVGSFFIPLAAQGCKHFFGSALKVFWVVGAFSVVASIPFLFVKSPSRPPPILHGQLNPFKPHKRAQVMEKVVTSSVVLLVFFTTAAETAIGNWVYTYSIEEVGLKEDGAALANSAFWGSFTVGRIIGAMLSTTTTPGMLLLCSTPFSLVGAALPIILKGHMSNTMVLAAAVLTGFGNSTGYANAVALLESYVQVTGFTNGLFGAVAGGACMVGPTTVAMLAKYTSLGYTAMAWVGLAFYILHFPAIITTIVVGNKLISIPQDPASGGAGDIYEPLLLPGSAPNGAHLDGSSNAMASDHRMSYDASSPVAMKRRASIPGHCASPTYASYASPTIATLHSAQSPSAGAS